MSENIRKKLIPGIEGFIERTLKELNLTPEIGPREFVEKHHGKKHRYATIARQGNGRMVVFYTRLHSNEDAKQKFLCDIIYLKKLHNDRYTTQYVPEVFRASTVNKKEWFTRTYIAKRPLGSIYHTERALTQRDAQRFVKFFKNIQHIPHIASAHIAKRDNSFSMPIERGNFKRVHNHFLTHERQRIESFLNHSAHIFKENATHAVHGDCHPGNVLYGKKQLFLIDWETVHLNLRIMDLAYFYAGLTHAPSFRRALIQQFEKAISWKKEFRELFPVGAVFYALGHLYTLSLPGDHEITRDDKKRVENYCLQIVKKGSKGYTELKGL